MRARYDAELPPILAIVRYPGRPVSHIGREEKSVHDHHRKKIFWRTFLASKRTFQAGGGYKSPIKTSKAISTTEIFPLWPPFCSAKRSSALCFLFPSIGHWSSSPVSSRKPFRNSTGNERCTNVYRGIRTATGGHSELLPTGKERAQYLS